MAADQRIEAKHRYRIRCDYDPDGTFRLAPVNLPGRVYDLAVYYSAEGKFICAYHYQNGTVGASLRHDSKDIPRLKKLGSHYAKPQQAETSPAPKLFD